MMPILNITGGPASQSPDRRRDGGRDSLISGKDHAEVGKKESHRVKLAVGADKEVSGLKSNRNKTKTKNLSYIKINAGFDLK